MWIHAAVDVALVQLADPDREDEPHSRLSGSANHWRQLQTCQPQDAGSVTPAESLHLFACIGALAVGVLREWTARAGTARVLRAATGRHGGGVD